MGGVTPILIAVTSISFELISNILYDTKYVHPDNLHILDYFKWIVSSLSIPWLNILNLPL